MLRKGATGSSFWQFDNLLHPCYHINCHFLRELRTHTTQFAWLWYDFVLSDESLPLFLCAQSYCPFNVSTAYLCKISKGIFYLKFHIKIPYHIHGKKCISYRGEILRFGSSEAFNSSLHGQNGRHFADDNSDAVSWMKYFVFWLKFH